MKSNQISAGEEGLNLRCWTAWLLDPLEFQPEFASLPQFRFHSCVAAQPFNTFAHDRQPNSRSFVIITDPFEHSKNALVVFGGDTDPIILNPDSHARVLFKCVDSDTWPNARWDEFHSVHQKIRKALRDGGSIAKDLG